jgi:hypothetical protein
VIHSFTDLHAEVMAVTVDLIVEVIGEESAMARLEGKVAFITGAARGQGRSHAIRLAEEGADIIAVDIASQIDTVPFAMATPEDLAQTVKEVQALDRRIVASRADVRDYAALKAVLDDGSPGSAGSTSWPPTPASAASAAPSN